MKKGKSTKKKLEPFEIGELDQYLFGQGNHYEIYEKMGAHKVTYKGKEGVYFAVWAPNARRVAVVGDFNGWDFDAFLKQIRLRIMRNSDQEQPPE